MKLQINLKFDSTIKASNNTEVEREFSVSDFTEYVGEYYPESLHELQDLIYSYMCDNDLDQPIINDYEEIDYDTFESYITNMDEIIEETKHLIINSDNSTF